MGIRAAEFQHYVKLNDVHVHCACTTPWFQAPQNAEFCTAVPQLTLEFRRAVGLQQPDTSCTLLGLWTLDVSCLRGCPILKNSVTLKVAQNIGRVFVDQNHLPETSTHCAPSLMLRLGYFRHYDVQVLERRARLRG